MSSSSTPPPPASPTTTSHHPKLPKFIRSHPRDRSQSSTSFVDVAVPPPNAPSTSNSIPTPSSKGSKLARGLTKKRSRLFGRGSDSESHSKASSSSDPESGRPRPPSTSNSLSSPPLVVSPSSATSSASFLPSRAAGRNSLSSSRPPSSFEAPSTSSGSNTVLPSNASIISTSTGLHRLSDIPGRLTGWLGAHFTPPSPASAPSALGPPASSSSPYPQTSTPQHQQHQQQFPPNLNPSPAPLPAPRHSTFLKGSGAKAPGPFEKAFRYLLDTDAQPDRSEATIWLLGTQYPGWERERDRSASASPVSLSPPVPLPTSPSQRSPSPSSPPSLPSGNIYAPPTAPPPPPWPPSFHASFSSLIYLTYRSHFKPIPPSSAPLPPPTPQPIPSPSAPTLPIGPESPSRKWLPWVPGARELTSDTGWGCMLRTGQMLLANALMSLLLPPLPPTPNYSTRPYPTPALPPPPPSPDSPTYDEDRRRYETYVRILTWFLDDPSPLSPFSVHRLALAGAEMGREVGQWFGPSIAAGSIRTLVTAFPSSGLGVVVGTDGAIYESAVFAASHTPALSPSSSSSSRLKLREKEEWGDRAVLVLLGLRLGIDGVNPIYYESVKTLFTLPQTVGIAGGRPSSSYYFVGTQDESLFYLDPHHTRPSVPLRSDQHSSSDPLQWLTQAEMRTFHCEKVRKMHVSGLDPSMLAGFLLKNMEEWVHFRTRVDELAKGKSPMFTILDAPPAWEIESFSDVGMESIASSSPEPDIDELEDQATPTVTMLSPEEESAGTDDDLDELGMDMEGDDDWEKTPGPRPSMTESPLGILNLKSAPSKMVPFPMESSPSPNSGKKATGPSPVSPPARTDRPPARPPAGPRSSSSQAGGAGARSSSSKDVKERAARKTDKLPALPPESFRERVAALPSPAVTSPPSRLPVVQSSKSSEHASKPSGSRHTRGASRDTIESSLPPPPTDDEPSTSSPFNIPMVDSPAELPPSTGNLDLARVSSASSQTSRASIEAPMPSRVDRISGRTGSRDAVVRRGDSGYSGDARRQRDEIEGP